MDDDTEVDDSKKLSLTREIKFMMYGFGDDPCPYTQSTALIEDIVLNYINEIALKALNMGKKGKIAVEDILFLIRHDPKKHGRVKELLISNDEIKKARKGFEEDKYHF